MTKLHVEEASQNGGVSLACGTLCTKEILQIFKCSSYLNLHVMHNSKSKQGGKKAH
jgi:hypothetical protein